MDQFGNELKKMLKAGLGAVAAGAEKAQEAIETLSQKGEPLYQQAKSVVTDAADRIKQAVDASGIKDAVTGKPKVLDIIDDLRGMRREDWALVRAALDEFEALADQQPEETAAEDVETTDDEAEPTPAEAIDDGAEPVESPEESPSREQPDENRQTDETSDAEE